MNTIHHQLMVLSNLVWLSNIRSNKIFITFLYSPNFALSSSSILALNLAYPSFKACCSLIIYSF